MQRVATMATAKFQPTSPVRETTQKIADVHFVSEFQPTSPVRETTNCSVSRSACTAISTHVPRAGDDAALHKILMQVADFNPRPPCGRRLARCAGSAGATRFQPTSPVRETTAKAVYETANQQISTHVPRAGDDLSVSTTRLPEQHFNPRPPCGRRRAVDAVPLMLARISTHVPRAGDDGHRLAASSEQPDFNPRPPCGRRLSDVRRPIQTANNFNPRPPCGRRHLQRWIFQGGHNFNPRPPCGRRL